MTRTEQTILKELKTWWGVVKDQSASQEEKSTAKKKINSLQTELKQIKPDTTITDWDAKEREYQASKGGNTQASQPQDKPNMDIANYQFKELDANQQDVEEKKIRAFFERKLIAIKVANEFSAFGFDNPASIGQAAGIGQ